jgi:hypothetical protein
LRNSLATKTSQPVPRSDDWRPPPISEQVYKRALEAVRKAIREDDLKSRSTA